MALIGAAGFGRILSGAMFFSVPACRSAAPSRSVGGSGCHRSVVPRSCWKLPVDLSLLRRVDRFGVGGSEQECLHVRHKELARWWITNVQPVVIDERSLVAEPLIPATLADRLVDPRAEFVT